MNTLDRKTPPPTQPITKLSLTAPERTSLENGIPVYTLFNGQLDLIHILLNVRAGILHEEHKHVSHFAYSLLKESSSRYSATETADLLDFYGAHITVSGNLDRTTIAISIPANNVTQILPTIFDFLARPQYRQDRLEIYQSLKIKDLEYNMQKTDVRNTQLLLHAVFGDSRTAGVFSNRQNLQAVTLEQMYEFHRQTFCAENLTLFLTGNIDKDISTCIRDLFSQVPHGTASAPILDLELPADPTRVIAEQMPGSVQSSIALSLVKTGYNAGDRREFSFLSTITGGYFGSRLMQNLRERNGYTYGVSAGSVYFGNQGLFIINSDVNADHTQAALDACFEELKRLQDEPVGDEELETVRNYLLGDLLRDVDNSVSYLKKFAYWKFFGHDEHEFQYMVEVIRNMKADTLSTMAKKYFDYNNFMQIIVGETRNLRRTFTK